MNTQNLLYHWFYETAVSMKFSCDMPNMTHSVCVFLTSSFIFHLSCEMLNARARIRAWLQLQMGHAKFYVRITHQSCETLGAWKQRKEIWQATVSCKHVSGHNYKASVCWKHVSGHPPACSLGGRMFWPLLSLFGTAHAQFNYSCYKCQHPVFGMFRKCSNCTG